jgi:hypothetical protein
MDPGCRRCPNAAWTLGDAQAAESGSNKPRFIDDRDMAIVNLTIVVCNAGAISMNAAPLPNRFEICEAVNAASRSEIYRFRYRIYVEQMGLRQKYADHVRKRVVEPLDEAARIYAAYFNGTIVGTIRGNRFSDLATAYYRKLYRIDDRFPFCPDEMSLTTKLMFDPALRRSFRPDTAGSRRIR